MNLPRGQSEMQEDKAKWRLCPVQDIDAFLAGGYGGNNTFSLLYCDLNVRRHKESLKKTMLEQESAFENQIHELHRLYQRQKELMMKMEGPRHLLPNTGASSPRASIHWMSLSISTSKASVLPPQDASAKVEDESDKSVEKVLDLEMPSHGYLDIVKEEEEEEEGSKDGEVHQVLNFAKDHSVVQPEHVQHLAGLLRSKIENGTDLNTSPLSSEQVKMAESEQPRELISASLHGKNGSEPSRGIVQALPCLKHISLFQKRSSCPRKKAKFTTVKTFPRSKALKGSNLDANFCVDEDDNPSLSNWTSPRKRRLHKPHIEIQSGKVTRKTARTKPKARESFLVTEEQEMSAAAEAILDMSLSGSARESIIETSDCITPLRWFANIASSAMALTEVMKPKEQRTNKSFSNIVPAKCKRTTRRQGKRQQQHEDHHNEILSSLSTYTGNDASQGLNKSERLIEASEANDARSSYYCSLMGNMVIDWGTITKRRRGIRTPKLQ